jgi:hypothetical protein
MPSNELNQKRANFTGAGFAGVAETSALVTFWIPKMWSSSIWLTMPSVIGSGVVWLICLSRGSSASRHAANGAPSTVSPFGPPSTIQSRSLPSVPG